MAGRNDTKGNSQSGCAKARRRRVIGLGTGAGAVLALGMTPLATAPAAHADILDLIIDPIIQPLMDASTAAAVGASVSTAASDALAALDSSAAADLSNLGLSTADAASTSGLSLGAIESALSTDPLSALSTSADTAAASSTDATTATNVDIPLTIEEGTEPVVDVSVNGGSEVPVLVDTGSSGLVIPLKDIGLSDLETLGLPTGIGISGYSSGLEYIYLTFDTTVDFDGLVSTSPTTVDVPIFSFPTSLDAPLNFSNFTADDDVVGILGVGVNDSGPGTSPITALPGDLSDGVLIDESADELELGPNPLPADIMLSGAPLTDLEVSVDGGTPVPVDGDIDSGGVYGTIPSSVLGDSATVPAGTTISVYTSSGELLYSYTTTATDSPTVTSGDTLDTGYIPFSEYPIYIDDSTDQTIFDES